MIIKYLKKIFKIFRKKKQTADEWRVAKSLLLLREIINDKAQSRSKISDGTIGDKYHASRKSDHNPWIKDGKIGVVTALDITHDITNGCDCNKLANSIVKSRDKRIKYIIWNERIIYSKSWIWKKYSGKNPHSKHIHISVKELKKYYDSTKMWNIEI